VELKNGHSCREKAAALGKLSSLTLSERSASLDSYQNMWYSIFDLRLNARQRPAAQWASTCLAAFVLCNVMLDTMGCSASSSQQAQMAAPLPPQQQQQARRHRRRRRAGTKGRKRGWRRATSRWREQVRCGHRRYRPAAQPEELPEEPAAVCRACGEATEGPGAAAYKGWGEAQLLQKKQLWSMLFDMPTLLQRDKRMVEVLPPDATEGKRASALQLGASDGTGRPVHGGWWSTGTVRTDGVSLGLCILRGRPKGAQQLVAPVPYPDPPNSFVQAAMMDGQPLLHPYTVAIAVDTGIVKPIMAVIPTVRAKPCAATWLVF
jgi:hypothetical protein